MNTLDHYLLKTASHEKKAFDQTIRNFGVDVLRGGGRVLRNFDTNPMVSSAVLGAGVGGIHGAMTARPGESRGKKALKNALIGGAAGGATGGLLAGSVKNLGRYGGEIEDAAAAVRGQGHLRDARAGDFANIMKDTVLNRESMRGGKKLKRLRDALAAEEAVAGRTGSAAAKKRVMEARRKLNQAGGGYGTRFDPLKATGMVAGAGLGSAMIGNKVQEYNEKNSSVRIRNYIDKQANFAQLAAKAVGGVATGAGKAVQVGAANPALAGAALGAGTGALAAGEGNRLKGMLGGAALGAAGGAAAGKFAPNAMKNVQKAGQNLSRAGKDTTQLASNATKGTAFKDMMSPQFKNVMDPFKAATP